MSLNLFKRRESRVAVVEESPSSRTRTCAVRGCEEPTTCVVRTQYQRVAQEGEAPCTVLMLEVPICKAHVRELMELAPTGSKGEGSFDWSGDPLSDA